jgi:ADP-heptose:LPS heptosyltransferase
MEQDGEEDGFSVGKVTYDLVVTPTNSTTEDIISALDNIDKYGIYVSNIRNTATNKATINKAVEDHFGPNIPAKKKSLEKQRGVPFPPKTKQAMDDFIKQFSSKPQLLKPTVEGDIVIFKQGENPTKDFTKKILQVVLNNAEIEYKISEKESI